MLPRGLESPRQVVLYYDSIYHSLIDSGQAHPFIYPWCGGGVYLVLLYLLIDHRQSPLLRQARYPIFACLCAFSTWTILTNKARTPPASFGVGLISALSILLAFAILVGKDAQSECRRVERARAGSSLACNGSVPNGHAKKMPGVNSKGSVTSNGRLFWQSYPSSLMDRVDWVCDLFTNFRGTGWNFQVSQLPPLPKWAEMQLANKLDDNSKEPLQNDSEINTTITSSSGIRRFTSRRALTQHTLASLAIGYIVLDLIKTIMHNDPYFWGYVDAPAPAHFPSLLRSSSFLLRAYRSAVCMAAIYTALWEIFKLGPLFFCSLLGPRWMGVRGEAFMNPVDMFASPAAIAEQGLVGWWGKWWHQTFRLGFEAPATYLHSVLGIEKRSMAGRMVSLFTAFFLSGFLHASGSYTQLGDTYPLSGPMLFFLLQPLAIIVQTGSVALLQRSGIISKIPKLARQTANVVLVHVWLYYTAPLLVDDFARGGVWLYEPVAVSPLRGLGFGQPDDGWFCWWYGPAWWKTGTHWYNTGISL